MFLSCVRTLGYLFDKRSALVAGRFFLLLLLLYLLFSCTRTIAVSESKAIHMIENIPFYPQEEYQCGPSSLSGVLNYYGVDVSPEDIALQIFSASAKGTLNVDMILYAEKKGLTAYQYESSFQDIKDKIHSRYPLIVMVDYGFWIFQSNHFMVVVGYNEEGIIVNSGREQFKFIPLMDFLKLWKRTQFWSLLITSSLTRRDEE